MRHAVCQSKCDLVNYCNALQELEMDQYQTFLFFWIQKDISSLNILELCRFHLNFF